MDATTETPSMDAPGEAATDDTSQWTEAEWAKWRKKKNKKYKNKENQKARRDADAKAKATAKAAAATGAPPAPPAPPAPRAPGDEPETEGAGTGEAASSSRDSRTTREFRRAQQDKSLREAAEFQVQKLEEALALRQGEAMAADTREKDAVARLTSAQQQIDSLNAELKAAKDANAAFQLSEVLDKPDKDASAKLTAAQKQIAELTAALEMANRANTILQTDLKAANEEVAKLLKNNQDLDKEKQDLEKEKQDWQAKLQYAQGQYASAAHTIAGYEIQVKQLRAALDIEMLNSDIVMDFLFFQTICPPFGK